MQIRKEAYKYALMALPFAGLVGCFVGPTNSSTTLTSSSTAGPTGKVTQGPVSGATVWADNLATGIHFVIDPSEVSSQTTTDSTGTYTLPATPSYKYLIVSQGGVDSSTGKTANTMVAPGGAQSISPLTTLVTLDTSGNLESALNAILPSGKTFDSDITAAGGLTPAAMVVVTSVTTAVTILDAAIQSAASKSGGTLTAPQLNNINLTLFSQMASQFSGLSSSLLSNTAALATNLQTALTKAIALITINDPNIVGLNASAIAASVANSSVAIAANVVGNATANVSLQGITASNVQTSGVAASISSSVTEASVLSFGTNAQIVNNAIAMLAASSATGVSATSTLSTYSPSAIAFANNPTVIGYELKAKSSGNAWSVSSLTITFSDDVIATTSGSSNYAHSVLNPANYQFTQAGCSPSSYASNVVTFTCGSLPAGAFGITVVSSSSSAGVSASATSLGLLVNNTKSFVLPAITGSTGGTGGSGLDLF